MRTNRLFWGGLLALAGLVLLAQNFGLIDPGFWKYIGAIPVSYTHLTLPTTYSV